MNQIAVLLTCFNRKETTLRCLKHLFSLRDDIDVYLVDDGCTDETGNTVLLEFPQVNLIKDKGDLFWCRGMNLAWKYASEKDYGFYIWLNDDVVLYEDAFSEILECSNLNSNKAVVSGVIEKHDKSKIIYGGFNENKNIIEPQGKMKPITFLNGNFVLIPKYIFKKVGFMDRVYHHDLGDVDYGLRTLSIEEKVVSTRKPIGSCDVNTICRERLNNTTLVKRFKRLYSPLGSNPNINFYFRKKYKGFFHAVLYMMFQLFINLLPDKLNVILFKEKYI